MTPKQEDRLRQSLRHWKRRALLMDRIGDRPRNREYTLKASAIQRQLEDAGLVCSRCGNDHASKNCTLIS